MKTKVNAEPLRCPSLSLNFSLSNVKRKVSIHVHILLFVSKVSTPKISAPENIVRKILLIHVLN